MAKNQENSSGNREIPVKVVSEFSVSDDELRHQRIAEKGLRNRFVPWAVGELGEITDRVRMHKIPMQKVLAM